MHIIVILILLLIACLVKSKLVYVFCIFLIFLDGVFVLSVEFSALRPAAEALMATDPKSGSALDGVAFSVNYLSPHRWHLVVVLTSLLVSSLVGRWRRP